MVIYCSKALQKSLKLTKNDMVKLEDVQSSEIYSWHGHIAKVDGRNTIVLMNDKTMYCMLFRNRLPRTVSKFAEIVKDSIPCVFAVDGFNQEMIEAYMDSLGDVVFAEKNDRQMTGNINRLILDMSNQWDQKWVESETIQAFESEWQNHGIRKIGKDYFVPSEEMLKSLREME